MDSRWHLTFSFCAPSSTQALCKQSIHIDEVCACRAIHSGSANTDVVQTKVGFGVGRGKEFYPRRYDSLLLAASRMATSSEDVRSLGLSSLRDKMGVLACERRFPGLTS